MLVKKPLNRPRILVINIFRPILNCSKLVNCEKGSFPIETNALWHILRVRRFGKLSVGNVKIRFPIKLSSSNWVFDAKKERSVNLLYASDSLKQVFQITIRKKCQVQSGRSLKVGALVPWFQLFILGLSTLEPTPVYSKT